ncbi:MAG: ATP-binding protein [Pseudohongiellaceae bacterium]
MPRRRTLPSPQANPMIDRTLRELLRLWTLRILVPLGGYREFATRCGVFGDALMELIDLRQLDSDGSFEPDQRTVRQMLVQQHQRAEREAGNARAPERLRGNVARLTGLLSLTRTDCRLMEFTALLHNESLLEEACDMLGSMSSNGVVSALAVILDLPPREIRYALGPRGALTRSGLLRLERHGDGHLSHKLDMLSPNFADSICSSDAEPITLLREILRPSPAGTLALDDFPHLRADLDLLMPFLHHTLDHRTPGTNILLHGAPGTGKTELARALAASLSCTLFDIANADEDGDPVRGDRRLRALRASQQVLARERALVVFDEVEDVFGGNAPLFGQLSIGQQLKGWVNRTLEENPVPTLWISNCVQDMDAAFLRRFSLVIEVPIPPRSQRERMIHRHSGQQLSTQCVQQLSEHDRLSPAVVARACEVTSTLPEAQDRDACVRHLINNTLQAQGHHPVSRNDSTPLPDLYDLQHLNTDADLQRLTQGLRETGSGRLCLYGPPGTGKTAFARWLAEELKRPLLACSASDLLSPWLGETEHRLAALFREAEQDHAVLLIDEVDSFLRERGLADKSWEITQVNELLVRLEQHSGIVIASTNRIEGLDRAALRRFDRKIRFDCLRPDQAWELLHRYCEALSLQPPEEEQWMDFAGLDTLTPGDFHAIARRHRIEPLLSTGAFIRALRSEWALKEDVGV